MELHELAKLFPPMTPAEFAGLKKSIAEQGLRDPVTVYDGKIIDGRNRWRACAELGLKAQTTTLPKGEDPLAFVLAKNLERRHLDETQRAMIAARLANLKVGTNQHGMKGAQICAPSQPEAASLLGVGRRTVQEARVVLERGAPELVRAVEAGRVAVSAAKALVVLPRKDQVAIAAEKDDSERRRLIRTAKDAARRVPKPEPPPAEMTLTPTKATRAAKKSYYTVQEWEALVPGERADIVAAGFDAGGQGMNEQQGSAIEWARWSHNTVTGCLHNCPYCYARDIAERVYPQGFVPVFHPSRLAGPASVAVPAAAAKDPSYRNVFANSMSDLFGQWVPAEWIEATIEMARRNPRWTFLTLTKFPQRAAEFEFPDNWWMGTTVDAQSRVDNAEKAFARVRCGTKWLSLEPLLEPLRFKRLDLFQWVVIGGASPSNQTPAWRPPYRWTARLTLEATDAGCRVYHKTNLGVEDGPRLREFPWATPAADVLAKPFRYLKGM
jgi:protein gp37/ParB-like chromosome segregation protein Spo0J